MDEQKYILCLKEKITKLKSKLDSQNMLSTASELNEYKQRVPKAKKAIRSLINKIDKNPNLSLKQVLVTLRHIDGILSIEYNISKSAQHSNNE